MGGLEAANRVMWMNVLRKTGGFHGADITIWR